MTTATPVHLPRILSTSVIGGCDRTARLVVISTRDEAERIVDCLTALWCQGVDALVVTNNCTDATAWLATSRGRAVIDCVIPAAGRGHGDSASPSLHVGRQGHPDDR